MRATHGWVRAEGDQNPDRRTPPKATSAELFLGEGLDRDDISAAYDNGVLTLTIPVAEEAKPARVEITHAADVARPVIAGSVADNGDRRRSNGTASPAEPCRSACADVHRVGRAAWKVSRRHRTPRAPPLLDIAAHRHDQHRSVEPSATSMTRDTRGDGRGHDLVAHAPDGQHAP